MLTPSPTRAIRNWTMIETLVTYVSAQTSVKVFRIAAIATTIGIRTAGSVPNTNRRMISAPSPPISPSSSTLGPPPADPEGLQRALASLVAGLARNREALIPALRDLPCGEASEDGEHDPEADDDEASTRDNMGETCEHGLPLLPDFPVGEKL